MPILGRKNRYCLLYRKLEKNPEMPYLRKNSLPKNYKYLGIEICRNIKWNDHIKTFQDSQIKKLHFVFYRNKIYKHTFNKVIALSHYLLY